MKKAVKLLSVFLLLAVFTNCQKDDITETEGRHFGPDLSPYKYLYGNDALKAKEKLRSMATAKKISTGILNGQKSDGWDIDFSEVLVMRDSIGRETYTARLTHPDMAFNQFYNLAFTEDENNSDASIIIVRYTMTPQYAVRLSSGQADPTGYEGSITFTPVFGGQLIRPGLTPVPNPVPEPETPETANPCEEEVTITYPHPGNGGNVPTTPGTTDPAPGTTAPGNGPAGSDLSFTDCFSWFTILCSENRQGHTGGNDGCTAQIRGATYLVNSCTGTVTQTKSNDGRQVVFGPCGKYLIGVLFPIDRGAPCPGDLIKNPRICPSSPGNSKGGTFGCTRKDNDKICQGVRGTKYHSGLDIKAEPGEKIYNMYTGTVVSIKKNLFSIEYRAESLGNYVEIECFINGELVRLKYCHLGLIDINLGDLIMQGDNIAAAGKSGNAANKKVIAHVHIEAKKYNASTNSWLRTDPEEFLTTKFNSATQLPTDPLSNCN